MEEYPVALIQITSSGRVVKMNDAFQFSVAVGAAFEKCHLTMPTWDEMSVDEFEAYVLELREKIHGLETEAVHEDEDGGDGPGGDAGPPAQDHPEGST